MKRTGIVLFLVIFSVNLIGQVKLPALISDGMVLQRNIKLKIWGWASANEAITVSFKGNRYKTKGDQQGNWSITIPAEQPGGPYNMHIKASNEIVINDIMIGDVWLCSGQSNMELSMERLKYKYANEIKQINNPYIRQFIVPDKFNFTAPQKNVDGGAWLSAIQKNIFSFSGVAWFFANELYSKYKIPIGLINSALGGSPAEAWISEEALKKFPIYYNEAQKYKNKDLITQTEDSDRTVGNSWYKRLNITDEGLKNKWAEQTVDSSWKEMLVPGYWADTEEGLINGSMWFRKEIDVPASMIDKPAKLELGRIVDADSVFINGQFVGTTGYQYPPRRYELKPGILKAGNNIIVIRVISNSGRGGFVKDKRYELTTASDTIDLKGNWKYKKGVVMESLPGQTFIRWKPEGLFNAMIAPLINYSIKGVIWYQGEANTSHADDYKNLMQTLITDWRAKWKQGDFPFIYVQLANFMEAQQNPQESSWAELRQQQLNTLSVSNTGMVVAIDLGEWNDIHPENKKDVGLRLALQAERLAYDDKKVIASGPLYQSMKVNGNKIVIYFSNTGTGLIAKNNEELKQFAIAGADGKYSWAKAGIKTNTVTVWNDNIQHPVDVQYAWADNPEGANLYNKEGLPASPFRAKVSQSNKHK